MRRTLPSLLAAAALAGSLTLVVAPSALGAETSRLAGPATCSGSISPGHYTSLVVKGVCFGPAKGLVSVSGRVTVAAGAALLGNYPSPKKGAPEGDATWRIGGGVTVASGGTFIMGCEAAFGCQLTTSDAIDGGITARDALSVIVHATAIQGRVFVSGGGGGEKCVPTGVFKMIGQPPYTDFEDNTVKGNLRVSDLASCWLGIARDAVDGNVTIAKDQLADPDAIEILSNAIVGSLRCTANSRVWDSAEASFGQTSLYPRIAEPNSVVGDRLGQCVLASPATEGGQPGPGPF
ncbi:MAG TPA: hypothetical protein VKU92_08040 [Acidimicrobiales bacterium]|nr:hypothetical protein [Acidimicrobiales bacterium]